MPDKPQQMWLDARYLDDHVLLTRADAWTFMTLPGIPTNLPTQEQVNDIVQSVEVVLAGLGDDVEIYYYLAYRDIETKRWAENLTAGAKACTPAWSGYLRRMQDRLIVRGYQERVLYLAVRLGARRGGEKPNLRGASPWEWTKAWAKSALEAAAGPDPQPSAAEVSRWRVTAAKVRGALSSSRLSATGAPANDVAWLIRHVQRLGMPDPQNIPAGRAWGAGSVHALAQSAVENSDPTGLTLHLHGRNMNIDRHRAMYEELTAQAVRGEVAPPPPPQAVFESHVAVLTVSEIPEVTASPWLFHASTLNFPVEVCARVRVMSTAQAEKEVAKAVRNQRNALQDAKASGTTANRRDSRRAEGAIQLQNELAEGTAPRQILATYRLIVTGRDREQVGARAEEVIRHYREDNGTGIEVEWPPGDQLALWQELIPGQLARTKLYEQRQDLTTFAVGLPFSVTGAGDGVGPYIGEVLTGNPTPVFFDLATAAGMGRQSTTVVTGTLGGGKTSFVQTAIDHFRLRSYPLIALDPKGDLKGQLHLRGRGDVRFFDLSRDGKPGSTDPFTLVDYYVDPEDPERDTPEKANQRWREETRGMVSDTLNLLLEHVRNDKMDTVVSMALNAEMAQPHPRMWHLLEVLRTGGVKPPAEAQVSEETLSDYRMAAIGAHAELLNASESSLGRLMFAPQGTDDASQLFMGGVNTTIVSLAGLDLPKDGRPARTTSERFSVALFALIAHQARQMLYDLDYVGPRALVIDEAHQITCLPQGRSLVMTNARMGRSRDIALVLATQSTADLTGSDLRGVISSVFAFRTGEPEERADIAVLLGRKRDDETVAQLLPMDTSPAGYCLYKDINGNVVLMRVDRWAAEYADAFETNPDRKTVNAAGRRVEADAFGVVRDPDGPVPWLVTAEARATASATPPAPVVEVAAPAGDVTTVLTDPLVPGWAQSASTPLLQEPARVAERPTELELLPEGSPTDAEGWWTTADAS